MKILCISDSRDPIVYSSVVRERFNDVDLVLAAGDLDLDYYGFVVSSLNKPLLFVFGNHNLASIRYYKKAYAEPFEPVTSESFRPSYGSTYVGGKVVKIKGVIVAGLGGSRRYNRGMNQYSELQMFAKMLRLVPVLLFNRIFHGRYLDILLTHAAPMGIGDQPDPCHRGFTTFLTFMKWFKPSLLIHGHIHLYGLSEPRQHVFRNTRVVNAYNHVVVDFEQQPKKSRKAASVSTVLASTRQRRRKGAPAADQSGENIHEEEPDRLRSMEG